MKAEAFDSIKWWTLAGVMIAVIVSIWNVRPASAALSSYVYTGDFTEPECGTQTTTHGSQVSFTRSGSNVTVDWINYLGRRPDSSFWVLENWKHKKSELYYWTGSSWALKKTVLQGGWLTSGERCAWMESHIGNVGEVLQNGGRVLDYNEYIYWAGGTPIQWVAPAHQHIL